MSGLMTAAHGQTDDSLVVDISECVNIVGPEARFECYERLARQQTGTEAEPAADPEPPKAPRPVRENPREVSEAPSVAETETAAETPAVTETDRSRPSLSERRAMRRAQREQERAQRALEPEAPKEEEPGFTATIADLRETVPNAWRVTLDNGQVWQQIDPKPYRLRKGMQVRLYTTSWGSSHRLTAQNLNGFILVREIR
jgi:hypothetical protein